MEFYGVFCRKWALISRGQFQKTTPLRNWITPTANDKNTLKINTIRRDKISRQKKVDKISEKKLPAMYS